MTENNSEFVQKPEVGNSAGDNNIVKEHPSRDSVAELGFSCNENTSSYENENPNTVMKSEECDSRLSNSNCEPELPSLHDHWLKLSTFFRKVYHSILDGEKPPNEYEGHLNIVRELIASDPHQLFARLEMDLQEFIIEVKLRQLELLNCVHTHEGPQLFIFCLIESYNKLMFAASTLSPLLSQLEKEHLYISWRGLNQHLFHKLVFTDPKIQKVIPLCISKLGKMNSKLSDFNKKLIRQFLNFDGEMIRIGAKWREAESSIIKYHQENSMLDAKERMMKVNWELIKTQSKVFHEELKSSGISSDVGSDILSNGLIMNSSNDDCSENMLNYDDDDKKSAEVRSATFQATTATVEMTKTDIDEQEVCESCHLDTSKCPSSSVPQNFESCEESKIVGNLNICNEILDEDSEILTHLNAEGRKMYSHLHKFKSQQVLNGGENVCTQSAEFSATDASTLQSSKDQAASSSTTSSSVPTTDLQKTAIRKHVIQQQQQQKKIMQMIQTSPQKDIQQKIQKQLQEQQILMQQQRKIEELQNHILQQHPLHMDKEMQKKMHLQMQQCLMQKHKQMEEKFHQQVQQHMQQHQEKPSSSAPSAKSNLGKDSCCQNLNHKCSTPVAPVTTASNVVAKTNNNVVTTSAVRPPPSKAVTTNVSTTTNVTHKNSTTQTTVTSMDGQNRAHHPLPDVVKSASYVCPKHSEGTKPNAHNHVEHDNCSDNSSDEDYSSERSNSPQRHCDCCYCEVFGPQSAPVRRNYQETRERLRSILNKKKAKSNAAAAANDGKVLTTDPTTSITGSVPRAASQGAGKPKKDDVTQDKSNSPLEYKGDKSIEEILDFIEGNKSRNLKRTAKKMRRKQRQLEEEERRRKEEEEAERLRLEELRRQEEEERRRLEEERRRQEQLLKEQNRKKSKKKGAKQTTNQSNMKSSMATASMQAGKKSKNQNNVANERLKSTPQNQKTSREAASQKAAANQQLHKASNATQKKQVNVSKSEASKQQPMQKQQQQLNKQKFAEKSKQPQPVKKNTLKKEAAAQNSAQKTASETKASAQPQMVTIKRVMQPNSSEPTVTITLRGPTPKDDKVLYTLLNGQMCQVKDDKNKKQTSNVNSTNNAKKTKTANANVKPTTSMPAVGSQILPPKNVVNFSKNCSIVGNGVNSITERMERFKLGPLPVTHEQPKRLNAPSTSPAELTTPTAIQINQAVNQLSTRPTFPNNFDLENIKLPPGITITKVDPATVQRKPIQVKQQPPPQPVPQTHIRQNMMSSVPGSSNVIVVDTVDKNNYYQPGDQAVGKKKRRKRRKNQETAAGETAVPTMPYRAHNGGLPPRIGPFGAGMFGNPFMNAAGYGNMAAPPPQQPAAIIQMNGSMVTIRNPAVHRAYGGPPMEYQDVSKMRRQNYDDKMLSSPPEDMENGDADDYERELEAFKRFCSQSVPAESKAKVNLNIEDIVLKKKGPVIGCS